MESLEEYLRFWVAFSVVDEDGVGNVSVGDVKARELPRWIALANVRNRRVSGVPCRVH